MRAPAVGRNLMARLWAATPNTRRCRQLELQLCVLLERELELPLVLPLAILIAVAVIRAVAYFDLRFAVRVSTDPHCRLLCVSGSFFIVQLQR